MACDYDAIRRDNERRYGTDIGRIGQMLLADRYDDRTHFIFELLQNAEDALAKRGGWKGKRSVRFQLGGTGLRISHFGKPFDEPDVRGICGIAESTKDLTAIGRFGIGFKSVNAFTDRPEVYSGDESFAIEKFVWPVAVPAVSRELDETLVVLPLRRPEDRSEIETGLKRLGAGALLFLRAIEEIEWRVEGGSSGLYLRSRPDISGRAARRISLIGQAAGQPDVEESWVLFSKPVFTSEGNTAGQVEIAFSIVKDEKSGREELRRVARSPLVAFFPTVVETHLGFLVQGPYRTTPSRDNVPALDPWNRQCVAETANVVREALHWLRDNDLLTAGALRCLPLERAKFAEGTMFAPVFEGIKKVLADEPLLPRHGGGHVAAGRSKLARTQELRDFFGHTQLMALLGASDELSWLSGDISQDRTSELHKYLIEELKIEEVRPETILPKLSTTFLEVQPDEWTRRLYEFLGDQKALLQRARELALVRLDDGRHVRAQVNGRVQAFLPGAVATGFPTVRSTVCDTKGSRDFLVALGLTEPDLVDDVIVNVLPRYLADAVKCDDTTYAADIERILRAFRTDSDSRRKRLVDALSAARFVAAREQHENSPQMAGAGEVYLATERLIELFAGVKGALIVDDSHACLKGEDVRTLLVACGGHRYLDPVAIEANLDWGKRIAIRREAGLERASWERPISDWSLRALSELVKLIGTLEPEAKLARAMLLWDALADLESRHGSGAFLGSYTWGYSHESKTAKFDAAFVRLLNEASWIADSEGVLHPPSEVLFESLGWKPNPFLLSRIRFKPPLIDQLAREAGIEPGVLDLLKKLGVTSEADLRARLGVKEEAGDGESEGGVEDALKKLLGNAPEPTPPEPEPGGQDPVTSGGGNRGDGRGTGAASGAHSGARGGTKRTPGSAGGRPFISYVGAHSEEEEPDPDGLDQAARMALEQKAIDFVLSREPEWRRTPTHNPGFDLYQGEAPATATRWCEVKAMTESLTDRPVGLSRTQFECARERREKYWLYVVERVGNENMRIVRIQDPAGKARTFTFDRGWLDIAQTDSEEEHQGD